MESSALDAHVRRAVQGDRRAIGHIWRAHHPSLVGWLKAVAPDVGEDIASDAWVEVMKNLAKFKGTDADFRSWLFTTARRRLIDHRRRYGRRPDPVVAQMPEAIDSIDAADLALRNIGSDDAVRMILRVLAPDQAEVILLRVLGGLDTSYVASVLDKREGAVRVLQHRGLRRLAEVMAQSQVEESLKEGVTE